MKHRWWGNQQKELSKPEIQPPVALSDHGEIKTFVEQRNCVRVNVDHIYCIVKFDHFGEVKLQKLEDKTIEGHVEDISLSGLKLVSKYELPVRSDISATISFQLDQFVFTIKGKIIRRLDHLNNENVIYGVEFTELLPSQQKQLNRWINGQIKLEH